MKLENVKKYAPSKTHIKAKASKKQKAARKLAQ